MAYGKNRAIVTLVGTGFGSDDLETSDFCRIFKFIV